MRSPAAIFAADQVPRILNWVGSRENISTAVVGVFENIEVASFCYNTVSVILDRLFDTFRAYFSMDRD